MQLINLTSLAAHVFRQFASRSEFDAIVAARGAFTLRQGAPMIAQEDKPKFQWADEYEGPPHSTCLIRPTDLAPHKPGTDVTLLGDAISPEGVARPSWVVGIRIGEQFDRRLRVTGPRRWTFTDMPGPSRRSSRKRWILAEPEPVQRVKLCWTLASGGPTLGLDPPEPKVHLDNPLGAGLLDEGRTARDRSYAAPQIEALHQPIAEIGAAAEPAGFGPLSPWWRPRLRHAGTYDETWRDHRHPLLPEDFDDRFWQVAPPGMVIEPWLQGDERILLGNLSVQHRLLDTVLPSFRLVVRVHPPSGGYEDRELALDGVHFDLRDDRLDCFLTWRVRFPLNDAGMARLVLRAVDMQYRHLPRPGVRNPLARR
jgi:hypothetical protein